MPSFGGNMLFFPWEYHVICLYRVFIATLILSLQNVFENFRHLLLNFYVIFVFDIVFFLYVSTEDIVNL